MLAEAALIMIMKLSWRLGAIRVGGDSGNEHEHA